LFHYYRSLADTCGNEGEDGFLSLKHGRDMASGVAYGIGAGALWGLVFLAPELVRDFSPLQLAIGRYLAYGVFSLAVIAPRWRDIVRRLTRTQWLVLLWLAFCGNTLYYVLLAAAVRNGGIAMTSLVIGFLPVAVTLIGSRDHGAIPLRQLAPSLLLSAAGALCIGWRALGVPAQGEAVRGAIGLVCASGALACWTSYAVVNARWLTRMDPAVVRDWNPLTGVVTGAQALLLIPLSLLLDTTLHPSAAWIRFSAVSAGVALIASMVGNVLWNRMSRLLPLTLAGQMILFETVFALLYGFLWERRLPVPLEAAAFVLLIASVVSCVAVHRQPAHA